MEGNPHIKQSHIGKLSVWDFYLAMIEHNEITLEKRNQSKVVRTSTLPKQTAAQPEKSHNYMIIANGIFYGGTEAEKVYLGNDLVWEKSSTPKPAHQIMGKFTDDSTEENWKCKINGNDIVLPVDPTTKEFGYDYEGEVTSLRAMFATKKIETLDLSNFDTSKVTDMRSMFSNCNALTTLDLSNFNTAKVTDMGLMFNSSRMGNLDLSGWDVSKVKDMSNMFNSYFLRTLDISGWNFDSVVEYEQIFMAHGLSTVLGPITGIKFYLDLHYSPLTNASAMVFINGLAEVTEAKTIQFKASTYDTLTPEQIAVATSKGWNVVRSA